jgi:AmmeMemoRadiSam system protein B
MADQRPRVRPLDIIPVQAAGQQAFLLRDPQRLSPREMVVPADMAYLLTQLDGTRTLREAQINYVRRFGTLLTTDSINDFLQRLDEAFFLDTDRFQEFKSQLEADFRARPTRPAAHAGQSYDDGAAAFITTWQPRLAGAGVPSDFALDERRPSFIAPHYDMNAAADCYAAAYALLSASPRPDVLVIFGVAHSGGESPFILTRKPFETPFGALETDAQIIDSLAEAAEFDVFSDEFLHRDEHSVEFQTALVHFVYREDPDPPKIAPILCSAYQRSNGDIVDPTGVAAVEQFLASLRGLLASDSRRVALIASADLSHIGARFGQQPANSVHLDLARRHDMALLGKAQAGDADGLYQLLAQEQDRYNVCGFPAIYGLLRALPVKEGRLLNYRQAAEPQTQSCVSFASLALA